MGMGRVLQAVATLLLPSRCAGCGTLGQGWCPACATECRRGRSRRTVAGCRVLVVGGAYEGTLRRAVLSFKRDRPGLAGPLTDALWRDRLAVDVDCVTWVPAGPGRRRRGFDQGRILARSAARLVNRPAVALLERRGRRGQQALGAAERRANAAGAIHARGPIPGWRVLLVDDVLTTGASLERSTEALLRAGARTVDAAVLAAVFHGRTAPHEHPFARSTLSARGLRLSSGRGLIADASTGRARAGSRGSRDVPVEPR